MLILLDYKLINRHDFAPFGFEFLDAADAEIGDAIIFAEPAAVFCGADGEQIAAFQALQDSVQSGFGQLDVGPQILDDLVAVGILVFDGGKDTHVQ